MRRSIFPIILLLLINSSVKAQISTEQVYKFNRVMDLISMFYVDTIQENKLVEKAIISVLKDLDPHSIYVSKEEVRAMNEPLIGSFDGIGITYDILRDTVYVISTHPGGPSDNVGLKAGDRIVSVENENIAGVGISVDGVKERISGNKGTIVKLGVKETRYGKIKEVLITREKIPIYSIDAAYQVSKKRVTLG
ncbi:MAG: PDZ domain-containing protein [Chloroflexia bacterium]|nr:PDZ domain-containing protein [Chloroflexia bacterium]